MAYDKELEARLDLLSLHWPGLAKKKMFGGVGYLMHGNMAFGVIQSSLVVRCGPEAYARCLAMPDVKEFDLTGRAMQGWVMVAPDALATEAGLLAWAERGRDYAATLPDK